MTDNRDGQFEGWRRNFTAAMGRWSRLVPSGSIGVAGVIYRVRHIDRPKAADGTLQSGLPQNEEEWMALGWTYRDGVISAHPEPRVDSELGRASLDLAEVCKSFRPESLEGEAGGAKRLGYALASATELLEESPDPVTKAHEDAVRRVESIASEIMMERT